MNLFTRYVLQLYVFLTWAFDIGIGYRRFKFCEQIFWEGSKRRCLFQLIETVWNVIIILLCDAQFSFSSFQAESVVYDPVRNNHAAADVDDDNMESRNVNGHHVVRREVTNENGQVETSTLKNRRLAANSTAKPNNHRKRRHCKRKCQDKCGNTNAQQVTSLLIY